MPRMGDLAATDVYNAFDVPLEQSTNVGWANRMGEILHARRPDDPTVVATTASPLVTITEGDIGRATEAAMGVSGGGLSVKGYHGSPITNLTKILAEPPTRQFDNATSQFGAFLAPSSQGAERYAGKTGRIYSAEIPAVKPYEMPWNEFNYFQSPEKNIKGERHGGEFWGPRAEELRTEALALKQKLQAAGHDSIMVRRPDGTLMEIASFGDVPLPPGIKAYHSSPHDFDKFDLAKIGTGEGAQVYGHGLYFAENPAVSGRGGQYWKQFANRFGKSSGENTATEYLARADFDREKAAQTLRDLLANPPEYTSGYNKMTQERMRSEALKLLEGKEHIGPRTYEVNINADPAHMLDWDKSFKEQSPRVQSILRDDLYLAPIEKETGREMYRQAYPLSAPSLDEGRVMATNRLREAGIPGIRYLDQGSRDIASRIAIEQKVLADPNIVPKWRDRAAENLASLLAEKQTYNHVIFDPNIIRIDRKYALPLATGAGMGALAAQDRYQQ